MAFTYNTDGYNTDGYFLAQEDSFTASATTTNTIVGTVNLTSNLSAIGVTQSSSASLLLLTTNLATNSFVQSSAVGDIIPIVYLYGDGISQSTLIGAITNRLYLYGAGVTQSTLVGSIQLKYSLMGIASVVPKVVSNLTTLHTLPLKSEVIRSTLTAYVELFKIDCSNIPNIPTDNSVFYLTTNLASDGISKVLFGEQAYDPYPIQITGISETSEGAYPRPTLDVANVYGYSMAGANLFNLLVSLFEDLIGAEVTYIRTFEAYLNQTSTISAAPMKFYISRKINHNSTGISFELRSPLDKERAYLPARQMLKRDFPGLGINKSIR
jgi:lambda family phage minor tail protein L